MSDGPFFILNDAALENARMLFKSDARYRQLPEIEWFLNTIEHRTRERDAAVKLYQALIAGRGNTAS